MLLGKNISDCKIGPRKTPIFYFNWLPWQRPLRNRKKLNELNKLLHPSTNPEILVKIGPLVSRVCVCVLFVRLSIGTITLN